MISPDAGNMGVKAVYVWAGLLIPTTVILWLYYPEVCSVSAPYSQSLIVVLDLWPDIH